MHPEASISWIKLVPPRQQQRTLHRARLTQRLLEAIDYRLTLVHAGTGYGKTTALGALAELDQPLVWYHLESEDADPLVLLLHLIYGFREVLGALPKTPLALLERWENDDRTSPWTAVVDALCNTLSRQISEPVFLVLDDAHHLNEASEPIRILSRFIARAPETIIPILSGRQPVQLPGLVNWRVRGRVLEIGQEELAFTPEEIGDLFDQQYGLSLTADQVSLLARRSEGWAIALQLVWQRLHNERDALTKALGQLSGSGGALFDYLAQEVLSRQAEDIQEFLRTTAVLRQMTAALCNCQRSAGDSAQILRYLVENELFVVDLGQGHVRYHRVFRDFLTHQSTAREIQAAHRQAAGCYLHLGDEEEALHHFLAAGAFVQAAELLVNLGRAMVRAGRLSALAGWIGALPPEVLEAHPTLMVYLGDIARLHSYFEEALGWYQQAEEGSRAAGDVRGVGQALRGQARVYLDTVDASKAEHLLQEALRLSEGQDDRQSKARLLELLAENLVNRGQSEEAEQYQRQARRLREEGPAESELSVRLLLRTGCLARARAILEERLEAEQHEPVRRPRAHRETSLLLSLVLAFQGEQERAYQAALEGTERGQLLNSQFITAVGWMRQGHAWLLRKDAAGYQEASQRFREAIQLSEQLEVPRLKIEAYWGLCQAHGFQGDLAEARQVAEQGIIMAQTVGDEWVEACIRTSLGASYALAGRYSDAARWLIRAGDAFRACTDSHGQSLARLWLCLVWLRAGDKTRLERDAADLLNLVRDHGYDFLFLRQTLLGPPDPRALAPILIFAQHRNLGAHATALLNQMGLARVEHHPGYQLKVQALGPFRVWRGSQEIAADEWRRKKARQLFQLLLTRRGSKLERDQIVDLLWPRLGPEEAERDFKIAVSALYSTLEPARQRNAPSAYIDRDGTRYGLRSGADLWLDAQEFAECLTAADNIYETSPDKALAMYRSALALYKGDYLQEYPYQEWSSEERERLLTLYLRAAERLAQLLIDREAWQEAIQVCQSILARDDCWENAYRMIMIAYGRLGNQVEVQRAYQRCTERLRAELDIEPAAATIELYASFAG
jgi:ATP/maltotriose-dependent transcriptional regulator MalT/two-component SAPR family response regulator